MVEKTYKHITIYSTPRCTIEITTVPSENSFESSFDSIYINANDESSLYITGRCSCKDFIELIKLISTEY